MSNLRKSSILASLVRACSWIIAFGIIVFDKIALIDGEDPIKTETREDIRDLGES